MSCMCLSKIWVTHRPSILSGPYGAGGEGSPKYFRWSETSLYREWNSIMIHRNQQKPKIYGPAGWDQAEEKQLNLANTVSCSFSYSSKGNSHDDILIHSITIFLLAALELFNDVVIPTRPPAKEGEYNESDEVVEWDEEDTFIRDARRQLMLLDIKRRLGSLVKSYVVSWKNYWTKQQKSLAL